jgi:two-component system, NtrC family, response regulator GlrR
MGEVRVTYDDHMKQSAREYLAHVLAMASGNVTRAARIAGRSRQHFHKLLTQYGIREPRDHRGNWNL